MTKARSNATAPAAKGQIVVGTGTDASGILSVGSANQVLTVDSSTATGLKWAAASSGWSPDYVLLNAGGTALTGATSVTISGISGKNALFILVDSASDTNGDTQFYIRFNSDSTSGNYGRSGWQINNTTLAQEKDLSTSLVGLGNINAASSEFTAFLHLIGTDKTGLKPFWLVSTVNSPGIQSIARNAQGFYKGNSAISSITFYSNNGNLDNGTIYVYGA